ncbi:serine/threonine kinase [Aureococcus anophagefferens]|nr:serine/threonine kinase [Aureococcus anophagefferens]
MAPPPAARRRRLSDSDLTCAATKRRFAALDIYAKATATSAGRSRHELVRLGELKPARRHSFDWLQFCRDGDRRPVARPPLTLFHELRYRLFQVREHLKEVMRGRDMGTKALFDSIDGDGSGEISREELGEAMRTIGVHVKATGSTRSWTRSTPTAAAPSTWTSSTTGSSARKNNARLMRREMLRFDPTVRELLRGFWVLSDADGSGSIDREEYMDLHLHLYAAMNVELVDAWGGDGPDKTASVLAKFLCFLMDRLSEIDDDRDAVVFKWADENEDWLDELKPIQDRDLPPLARRASIEDLSAEEVGAIMASRRASFQFASGPSSRATSRRTSETSDRTPLEDDELEDDGAPPAPGSRRSSFGERRGSFGERRGSLSRRASRSSAGDDFLGAELGRRRRSEMSGSILINDLEKGDDASYARQDLLPFEAAGLLEELLEDRLADDDDAGLGERRTRQQLLAELSRRGLGGESTPDYDETPEERSLRLGLASGAETPASLARSLQDLDGDDAPGAAYAEALGDLDRRLTELKQRLRGGDVSVEAEIGAVEARARRRKVEASRSVAALERAIVAMMPRLADLRSRVAAGELDCEDEYRELEARVRGGDAPASDADEVAELERRVAAAARAAHGVLGRIHSPVDKRPTQFPALEDVGLTFATENALRPRTLRLTGDGLAEPDFEFSKRYDAFDRSREPGRPGWAKALYASLAGARDPFGRRNAKRRGQYLRDHGIATYGARGAASVAAPPPPDDDDAATLDCGDSALFRASVTLSRKRSLVTRHSGDWSR